MNNKKQEREIMYILKRKYRNTSYPLCVRESWFKNKITDSRGEVCVCNQKPHRIFCPLGFANYFPEKVEELKSKYKPIRKFWFWYYFWINEKLCGVKWTWEFHLLKPLTDNTKKHE